jgi:hypothetical protein
VAGQLRTDSTASTWQWTELYDTTGVCEDMSFMLFNEPTPCDDGKTAEKDDGDRDSDDKKDPTTTGDSEKKS